MRTSSHHQPEAQHPKSPAIYTPAGRLPHLWSESDHSRHESELTLCAKVGPTAKERESSYGGYQASDFMHSLMIADKSL